MIANFTGSRAPRAGLGLHRSNSSLELVHSPSITSRVPDSPLRREYGSHGSIDVFAQQQSPVPSENILAMLQELRPVSANAPELLLRRQSHCHQMQQQQQQLQQGTAAGTELGLDQICGSSASASSVSSSSPKLRLKLNRLWGGRSQRSPSVTAEELGCPLTVDLEDRQRRRALAHYDCQSMSANLGYAVKLRSILLARRRNTATGASAAQASALRASTPDQAPEEDIGDDRGNDLLEPCPFFRNEVGGEGQREVGLTRGPQHSVAGIHRPPLAYGVSVLEPGAGETLWKYTCPFQRRPLPIECVDDGAYYYRRYFLGREHQNWFGMDEQLGPVAVSLRRDGAHYRVIVRTSELYTLRGSVPDEALSARPQQGRIPTRELLDLVAPEVQTSCLRLGTSLAEEQLARLDEQGLSNKYKVGVLYCKSGQRTEEEMYNNEHAGPAFLEFLETIGQRVSLRGFEGYKAGLDTRTDSTGTHTVAATHRGCHVTFHVSTMLPFTPNNRQQLLRKRHIGNDIVTIVFQEPGALPFSPKRIRSQFQHVFIIVKAENPCTENTQYVVSVTRSKEVPVFGPPIPLGATFSKGKLFTDFILAKVINAENAAHRSEKFATMATRTRQEYLKDLTANYSSATVIETGPKFSMLSFSSKKKSQLRPKLSCSASQRGAMCWQVILEDSNRNTFCYLGISVDSVVLIEEHSRQILFAHPCISILGWHTQLNSIRIYYHQGECITFHMRGDHGDREELMEIVARLRAVTEGSSASELSLKRNALGQLGFHVQPDGVVTQVESMGSSWQAGLRQGSRLVEICKIAVSTLNHDQMVDLLKTSAEVTVTVIPPTNEGLPRRGCLLQNCQFLSSNYEGDFESATDYENTPVQQTALPHHCRRYERSFSPPRSSNSSGYGTGSSSRSFNDPRFPLDGTMTSSSSGHSVTNTEDRWYELLETQDTDSLRHTDCTPPSLPARQNVPSGTANKSSTCTLLNNKEIDCHYGASKNYNLIHGSHDHIKGSKYLHAKIIQDNFRADNYQRIDIIHPNYVKLQKEKYETKQENLFVSQRELQKNEAHKKLSLPNSLLTLQNTNYCNLKSMSKDKLKICETNQNQMYSPHSNYEVFNEKQGTHQEIYEKRKCKFEKDDLNQQVDLNNDKSDNQNMILPQDFKVGERVTCMKIAGTEGGLAPQKIHTEYRPKDFSSSLPPDARIADANITDLATFPSEDELSNESVTVSPRLRRSTKTRVTGNQTPSSTGSGNQSPRPKFSLRGSHRNSVNLTSSTFQEDLIKLINPDYLSDDGEPINNQNTKKNQINKINNNSLLDIQNRCRSRENLYVTSPTSLSVLQNGSPENGNSSASEVILTMARPATVISNASTASSPAPSENKMTREERLSPRVTKTPLRIAKLSTGISNNTERIEKTKNDTVLWKLDGHCNSNNRNLQHIQDWSNDLLDNSSDSITISETGNQNHLTNLEIRCEHETRQRLSLEEEVRRLRDENRRLQDENHAATQQIKRFTEWFIIYHQ